MDLAMRPSVNTTKIMRSLFQLIAVILAGFAANFLWKGDIDGVFISIVLAAVSFLLSIRFQIKERMKEREADNAHDA